jgi:hypothetical protein
MSWEFWGIVTSFAIVLGVGFFGIALLYSRASDVHQALRGQDDGEAEEPSRKAA